MPIDFWNKYAAVEVAAPKHPGVVTGLPDLAFTCGDNCSWTLWNDTSLPRCEGLCGNFDITSGPFVTAFSALPPPHTHTQTHTRTHTHTRTRTHAPVRVLTLVTMRVGC